MKNVKIVLKFEQSSLKFEFDQIRALKNACPTRINSNRAVIGSTSTSKRQALSRSILSRMALVNVSLDDLVAMKKVAEGIRSRSDTNNTSSSAGGSTTRSSQPGATGAGPGRRNRAATGTGNGTGNKAGSGSGSVMAARDASVEKLAKVVVSNVSPKASQDELDKLFQTFGRVLNITAVDRELAATEVTYASVSAAEEARNFCDGIVLGDTPLRVDVARRIVAPQAAATAAPAAPGGGDGGGRGSKDSGDGKRAKKKITPIVYDLGASSRVNAAAPAHRGGGRGRGAVGIQGCCRCRRGRQRGGERRGKKARATATQDQGGVGQGAGGLYEYEVRRGRQDGTEQLAFV